MENLSGKLVHGRNAERGARVVAEIEAGGGAASFLSADLSMASAIRNREFVASLPVEEPSPYHAAYRSAQTALVTGSTDGVGRLVARELGQAGTRVPSPAPRRQVDAPRRATVGRLDILINNAGIGTAGPRQASAEGFELRFAVNYLAGFLLTLLLLPLIKNSAPARIVNVSSAGQQPIDFDDVMLTRSYSGARAYCQSKLAQVMFTIDLGTSLKGTGVTVTCLHPATYMDTSMVRRAGVRPLSTVEEGARAILNLARSPAVEGQTALYFNGLREAKAQAQAYDPEVRRRLQALSLELTGLSTEGVAALDR